MTLKQTRLVTIDVAKLTRFYENVSQSKAEVLNSSYVQFQDEACKGLAIVELASTRAYGEGVAEPALGRGRDQHEGCPLSLPGHPFRGRVEQ
jgi:hypothetical protein